MTELDRLAASGWRVEDHATFLDGVWHVGDGSAAVNYPAGGFVAIESGSSGNYWFDHRADAVADALEDLGCRSLWEVGAGSGAMSHRLEARGMSVVAVEPLLDGARQIADGATGPTFCGLLHELALPDGSLPAVGMFDVLEHLDDPEAVLAEVRRILLPGGLLVLTVPALQWLWSDEDDVAGHQLRYTRRTLRAQLRGAGFAELRASYLYASLVAPAAAIRALPYRLGRRRTGDEALGALEAQLDPAPRVDRAIRAVLRGEAWLGERVQLPVGTSILGIYRRPI